MTPRSTQIVRPTAANLARLARVLQRGGIVGVPTETVYGLAANALDAKAVAKIYEIKGRPAHNPIIVHVAGVEMAKQCVTGWPNSAEQLKNSFWPGPTGAKVTPQLPISAVVTPCHELDVMYGSQAI